MNKKPGLKQRIPAWIVGLTAVLFFAGFAQAGSLEPVGPPGPTTQIPPAWSQILPDADRFEVVMGGAAVLDKETGLVWEKSPDTSTRTWVSAIIHCFQREVGGRKGWRLPTLEELASLVDTSVAGFPKLPSGHPFLNVMVPGYWSSTTNAGSTPGAWLLPFADGIPALLTIKTIPFFVWCVRGGSGHDGR